MLESETTPDKYESEILLLVGWEHALLTGPENAASVAVVSLPTATEREGHVRLFLCFN